ncbi:hypothetical protein [Shimia sediminis]|uniref:hypothetical protein n=1 Tax=Shimia sediminis TaxID=2497945 RepID=UPI000F8F4152|nr:hypothetical protein [Shimia sediminis]
MHILKFLFPLLLVSPLAASEPHSITCAPDNSPETRAKVIEILRPHPDLKYELANGEMNSIEKELEHYDLIISDCGKTYVAEFEINQNGVTDGSIRIGANMIFTISKTTDKVMSVAFE